MTSLQILLSLAAFYDFHVHQIDVKTTFLNGIFKEDIYMDQPYGFVDSQHPQKVCKLLQTIYDLKQSPRCSINVLIHTYWNLVIPIVLPI